MKVEIDLNAKMYNHFQNYAIPQEEVIQGILNKWWNENEAARHSCESCK